MIYDQTIEVTISNNGKHYASLGYTNTKQGSVVLVDVKHIPPNSQKKIKCKCDVCGVDFIQGMQVATRQNSSIGRHECHSCARARAYVTIESNGILAEKNRIRMKEKSGENSYRYNPNTPAYKRYLKEVSRFTRQANPETLPNSELRGLCGVIGATQLDHVVSVSHGFKNNIHPAIIGCRENLRFISWEQNRNKHHGSDMTIGELFARIEINNSLGQKR